MQITFTFDSLEEMQKAVSDMARQFGNPLAGGYFEVKFPKEEKPKKAEKHATAPAPVKFDYDYPDPDPAETEADHVDLPWDDKKPAPAEEKKPVPAAVDESYRVEVRKALAALNKKVPGNPARDLIQKHCGVDKLSDAPLDTLQGLMEAAMEALQSA